MKHKIGDNVRVKKYLLSTAEYKMENSDAYNVVTEDMKELCGKVVTISSYFGSTYRLKEDLHVRNWTDEMFE